MKFYSEVTKKLYSTEKELLEAEKEAKAKKLKEDRAARAKVVEAALKGAESAKKKADMLLNDFIKDYGYFHTSYTSNNALSGNDLNDFVSRLFSFLGEE